MEAHMKLGIGMKFENVEVAWEYWRAYGGRTGFGVRKEWFNTSKKDGGRTSQRFVCSKDDFRRPYKSGANVKNPRKETRIGCMTQMGLTCLNEKYKVYEFVKEHNHELHTTETSHLLRSQCKISEVQAYEIELAKEDGLHQKNSFNLMSKHAGGRTNIGFTREDANNYLSSKRQRDMEYGEVGALLKYFQNQLAENPSFFHAYHMDSDEQMMNVFWADPRMLLDYGFFGDVLSLDTTFDTNGKNRPLAIFCGFNHYREAVIFGAGLLYDETVESFRWLFRTFLVAHRGKKSLTLFTDQDSAMAKALNDVMPITVHGLCTWHLMCNAAKRLSPLPRGESHILKGLRWCMYETDNEEEFEFAWNKLLMEHNIADNNWIKTTYKLRKKWVACFMKQVFTLRL